MRAKACGAWNSGAAGRRYNNGALAARWREAASHGHDALHAALVKVLQGGADLGWQVAITSVVAKWSKTYAADNVAETVSPVGAERPCGLLPESMRRRKNGPEFPPVYFLQSSTGHIKIGFSSQGPTSANGHPDQQPRGAHAARVMPGSFAAESALHRRFAQSRASGEWFRPTPELLGLIERLRATRMRRPLTVADLLDDRLLRETA